MGAARPGDAVRDLAALRSPMDAERRIERCADDLLAIASAMDAGTTDIATGSWLAHEAIGSFTIAAIGYDVVTRSFEDQNMRGRLVALLFGAANMPRLLAITGSADDANDPTWVPVAFLAMFARRMFANADDARFNDKRRQCLLKAFASLRRSSADPNRITQLRAILKKLYAREEHVIAAEARARMGDVAFECVRVIFPETPRAPPCIRADERIARQLENNIAYITHTYVCDFDPICPRDTFITARGAPPNVHSS